MISGAGLCWQHVGGVGSTTTTTTTTMVHHHKCFLRCRNAWQRWRRTWSTRLLCRPVKTRLAAFVWRWCSIRRRRMLAVSVSLRTARTATASSASSSGGEAVLTGLTRTTSGNALEARHSHLCAYCATPLFS